MDSSQDPRDTSATTPIPYEHIRCAPGILLSPDHLELLARSFSDSTLIFVKREFRSGYSGAVVLLVSLGTDQAPIVVKLAQPLDLEREYQAYQQFVRQISPQNIAHLRGEPLLSADGQLGLIQYTFAGGETQQAATSLKDYYETNGGSACGAVLNRIFRAHGRYWWANNRPELYTLGEQYDRLLPVHLQVAPSVATETPGLVIEQRKTSLLTLRQLQVGEHIRLVGFQVAKVQAGGREITFVAPPPPNEASALLRIRLELDAEADPMIRWRPGEKLEQLDAVVVASRQTLLCTAATEALPSFDPNIETFTADIGGPQSDSTLDRSSNGAKLLNPLYDLSGLLDQVVETKVSTIHGDLNLENVLVDLSTSFAWLVDFSETRRGPTLLDLQRLEVQVITKLVPNLLQQSGLRPIAVVDLLLSMHADPLPTMSPHTSLQEPFQVLVTIRRLARQYLIDDLDWDEYYRGQIVALVGALKYKELDALARILALTCAATLQGLLGQRLETNRPIPVAATLPPTPARRTAFSKARLTSIVVGLIVLLVLLVIGRPWVLSITPQLGGPLMQTPANLEIDTTRIPPEGKVVERMLAEDLLQADTIVTESPPPSATKLVSVSPTAPLPTRVPVAASPGETLLVVAQFANYGGETSFNIAGRIQEAIQNGISAAHLAETRVVVWPEVVVENGSAESVLAATGAAMMIWGEYDSGRVRVSFTRPAGLTTGWQQLLNSPSELSTTINLDVPREAQALALLTVGQLYRDAGEVDKAKAAFVQALGEQPREDDTVATISFYLAYLYAASHPPELDQAIDAYGQTIALRPEWFNARYNRGLAYFERYWQNGKSEELDAAIADLDEVLAEHPNLVDALLNRGIAFYTRNHPDDLARAITDFDRALAQDGRSLKAYYNRGLAHIRAGNRSGWESDLARALELLPDYTNAIYALCWGYALDNLPDKGLPYCETATAADMKGYTRDARGLVYAELGQLDEAAVDFELYLAWLRMQPSPWYQSYHGATYADMIDAIRAGQNPITTELLASLR